jgi:hypothetical protein
MTSPEHAPDPEAVIDYEAQAREFLAKGREYLTAGDLHQASEKGWGAAAHMAKAVAEAQGWTYSRHADFNWIINQAFLKTGNDRLRELRGIPNDLHGNYYVRKRFLDAEVIGRDIENVSELVDLLAPLTVVDGNGNAPGE